MPTMLWTSSGVALALWGSMAERTETSELTSGRSSSCCSEHTGITREGRSKSKTTVADQSRQGRVGQLPKGLPGEKDQSRPARGAGSVREPSGRGVSRDQRTTELQRASYQKASFHRWRMRF